MLCMSLSVISKDGLISYLAAEGAELGLSNDVALGDIIRSTCNRIAAYVNTNEKNDKLALNVCSVPEELEQTAYVLVKHAVIASAPGDDTANALEGTARAKEYNDAMDELKRVARGELELAPFNSCDDRREILFGGSPLQDWTNPL